MSHPAKTRAGRAFRPDGQDDLFALTRALVFTKEAYQSLRLKGSPRPAPPTRRDGGPAAAEPPELSVIPARRAAAAVGDAARADSFPIAAARPDPALTPWDLMDEDDSPAGVTFAAFQHRPDDRFAQDAA